MTFQNIVKHLNFIAQGMIDPKMEGVYIGDKAEFILPKGYIAICDENTSCFADKFSCNKIIIKEKATENAAIKISNILQNFDGAVAIGGGTVCDIVKLGSFLAGKPFIVYATALSMNGYASNRSSLIKNGERKSFKGEIARAIYFDLEILRNAPLRLIKAGFADTMARFSAENDCLLSHIQQGNLYKKILFDIRRPSEEKLLKNYVKIVSPDDNFLIAMIENIILSGIAMNIEGSSAPASGGEHAIAHVYETTFALEAAEFLHGEMVAGFTLEMLKIQESKFALFAKETIPTIDFHKGYNLLHKIYTDLLLPTSFQNYGLDAAEFEKLKLKAIALRKRYGFLNI